MHRNAFTAPGCALFAALCANAAASAQTPGDFDYYVFTLSWSPGFCDTGGAAKQPAQCASGAGAGFVVHGLWPNRAFGANPEDCQSGASAPAAALRLTDGVYPDEGLARYEFRKHGACSGLDAEGYFTAVKRLHDVIAIPEALRAPREAQRFAPDDIVTAFVAANPNLQADDMAITCGSGELIDVRICVAKDLAGFAQCPPKVAGHTCHSAAISVAPLR
jgi:ribonuclease T2